MGKKLTPAQIKAMQGISRGEPIKSGTTRMMVYRLMNDGLVSKRRLALTQKGRRAIGIA
jgi:hypothetical protein